MKRSAGAAAAEAEDEDKEDPKKKKNRETQRAWQAKRRQQVQELEASVAEQYRRLRELGYGAAAGEKPKDTDLTHKVRGRNYSSTRRQLHRLKAKEHFEWLKKEQRRLELEVREAELVSALSHSIDSNSMSEVLTTRAKERSL
jgi:hypothetical protein